jgi:site-specific DNA-cytosine methylase
LADPKVPSFNNIMRIAAWDDPSPCVTGGRTPSSGGISVSDPRAAAWANAGHYGIIPWDKPSPTVTGAASCDNGKSSIADRRINNLTPVVESGFILVAPDETWHRPLTILEKAALQGFPWRDAAGVPLLLDGKSQAKWQERVGNAIPPPAAQAIGNEMIRTLLMSKLGQTFALSSTKQWVRPVAVALALPY